MVHIDLFSGIGGFALAVDEVFGKSEHIFCEIDSYCQALLKKRFKGAKIYGDIRSLSRERLIADTDSNGLTRGSEEINTTETEQQTFGNSEKRDGAVANTESERINREHGNNQETQTERERGLSKLDGCGERPFILTGGFPCQPFSQAGKRKGTDDNRYLWPEMLRVIRDFKPTWVIAENVRGILSIEGGMVFEQVCLDLEGEGYEVQAFVIPAVAKNAPHRRDRVWFVANRSDRGCGRGLSEQPSGDDKQQIYTEEEEQARDDLRSETVGRCGSDRENAPDTDTGGIRRYQREGNEEGTTTRNSWERNWLEVATELCGVDDGLSAELDGLKLSKSKHRVERLKALGNAIVPQVAIEIMRGIVNN